MRTAKPPGQKGEFNAPRKRFGFLVVPDFAFYGLFPAIEALRVANYNSGRALYDWCVISVDGKDITATNGMVLQSDCSLDDCPPLDVCFVVAGNHPLDNCPVAAIRWLRKIDRKGTVLGAFDSGIFLLAAAGLLDRHVSAVHWEILPIMRENYPRVSVTDQLYNIDSRRVTGAGGTSTADLLLALIAADHGDRLADIVARGLVHWPRRRGSERQIPANAEKKGSPRQTYSDVLQRMHSALDDPPTIAELARGARISQRALETLFKQQSNLLPSEYLRALRLKRAQEYLFYSRLQVSEISVACGYTSPTVFCRAFKRRFGIAPNGYRKKVSVTGLQELNHPRDGEALKIGKSFDPGNAASQT